MSITKPDGSSYLLGGKDSLKSYRPDSQDQKQFDEWDQEQIELAGSPIMYYPCYIDTDYDHLYMESIDSIIAQEGYELYAKFEPVRPMQDLGPFGIDSLDELFFNFNLTKWREIVGQMPKIKSLIFTVWDKAWFEIIQNDQEQPYKLWKKYRLQVHVKKYQPSRAENNPTRRDSGDNSIQIY
ncbi:MAG TPA: hypothetical protein VMZ91_12060 [Candidatus Paceibacterota bacterium]|nr:hypothetical protein [Candidatus Paceibacterota bacterium]